MPDLPVAPILGILRQTLRHATIGLAVASMLMMALRIHLHAQSDDGHWHGHGFELPLGSEIDDTPGAPAAPDAADPDDCGSCNCPGSSVLIAELPAFMIHDQVAGLARLDHPAAVHDSLSYPPDPPPVRPN